MSDMKRQLSPADRQALATKTLRDRDKLAAVKRAAAARQLAAKKAAAERLAAQKRQERAEADKKAVWKLLNDKRELAELVVRLAQVAADCAEKNGYDGWMLLTIRVREVRRDKKWYQPRIKSVVREIAVKHVSGFRRKTGPHDSSWVPLWIDANGTLFYGYTDATFGNCPGCLTEVEVSLATGELLDVVSQRPLRAVYSDYSMLVGLRDHLQLAIPEEKRHGIDRFAELQTAVSPLEQGKK